LEKLLRRVDRAALLRRMAGRLVAASGIDVLIVAESLPKVGGS
jgi:hypothetical protein